MNTVEALQALYVAQGGNMEDVAAITTIPEMINALATLSASKAGAATSELPKVTSSDNGKVLTVVNGKWAKAALPADNG